MKALKILLISGFLAANSAQANDIEAAFDRFDDLRGSDARVFEKTYGAFEYFSVLSRVEAKPASFSGCLKTLQIGQSSLDPCIPVFARAIGGGTGGVD